MQTLCGTYWEMIWYEWWIGRKWKESILTWFEDYPDIHLQEFIIGTSWIPSRNGIHRSVSVWSIGNGQSKDLEKQAKLNLENTHLPCSPKSTKCPSSCLNRPCHSQSSYMLRIHVLNVTEMLSNTMPGK
jgi:hypothetical protein